MAGATRTKCLGPGAGRVGLRRQVRAFAVGGRAQPGHLDPDLTSGGKEAHQIVGYSEIINVAVKLIFTSPHFVKSNWVIGESQHDNFLAG